MPIIMAAQDVQFAFDSMQHTDIAAALRARGVCAGLIAAHLRELVGKRASISLPGVGKTTPFQYTKSGKQGGIQIPEECNALLHHIFEPLVFIMDHERLWFYITWRRHQSRSLVRQCHAVCKYRDDATNHAKRIDPSHFQF